MSLSSFAVFQTANIFFNAEMSSANVPRSSNGDHIRPKDKDPNLPSTPVELQNRGAASDTPGSSTTDVAEPGYRLLPNPVFPNEMPVIKPYVDEQMQCADPLKLWFNNEIVSMPDYANGPFRVTQLLWAQTCIGINQPGHRMGPFNLETKEPQHHYDTNTMVFLNDPANNSFRDVGWIQPGGPQTVDDVLCQRVFFQRLPTSSQRSISALSCCWIPITWLSQMNAVCRSELWPQQPNRFGNNWHMPDFQDKHMRKRCFSVVGTKFLLMGFDPTEFAVWGDELTEEGTRVFPRGHSSMFYINDLDIKNNTLKAEMRKMNAKINAIYEAEVELERSEESENRERTAQLAQIHKTGSDDKVRLVLQNEDEKLKEEMESDRKREADRIQEEERQREDEAATTTPTEVPKEDEGSVNPMLALLAQSAAAKGNEHSKLKTPERTKSNDGIGDAKVQASSDKVPASPEIQIIGPGAAPSDTGGTGLPETSRNTTQMPRQEAGTEVEQQEQRLRALYPDREITGDLLMEEIVRLTKILKRKDDASSKTFDQLKQNLLADFKHEASTFFRRADLHEQAMFEKLAAMTDIYVMTQEEFTRLGEIAAKMEANLGFRVTVSRSRQSPDNIPLPFSDQLVDPSRRRGIQDPTKDVVIAEVEETGEVVPSVRTNNSCNIESTVTSAVNSTSESAQQTYSSKAAEPRKPFQRSTPIERMSPIPNERPLSEGSLELDRKRMDFESSKTPLALFLSDVKGTYQPFPLRTATVRTQVTVWVDLCKGRSNKKNRKKALDAERKRIPTEPWDQVEWETHPWCRDSLSVFRLMQAGEKRSKAIVDKEDIEPVMWMTREYPEFDWRQTSLGVKEVNTMISNIQKELRRTEGTMVGVGINNVWPNPAKSRPSESSGLDKRLAALSSTSSSPSRQSTSGAPPATPAVPAPKSSNEVTPRVSGAKKRNLPAANADMEKSEPPEKKTREAKLKPFSRQIKPEKYEEYKDLYEGAKQELTDAKLLCKNKTALKNSISLRLLHVLKIALDALVEKRLSDKTELGWLSYREVHKSLQTLGEELNNSNDRITGLYNLRRYPFICYPCEEWKADEVASGTNVTDDAWFHMLQRAIPVAFEKSKSWASYCEVRQINAALPKGSIHINNPKRARLALSKNLGVSPKEVLTKAGFPEKQYLNYDQIMAKHNAQKAVVEPEEARGTGANVQLFSLEDFEKDLEQAKNTSAKDEDLVSTTAQTKISDDVIA